jgi:hypothetical protein
MVVSYGNTGMIAITELVATAIGNDNGVTQNATRCISFYVAVESRP